MAHASGYYKTRHEQELVLLETRTQRAWLGVLLCALAALFAFGSPFLLDLANQVLLAIIGSVALMLLSGFAGQVSLGHAGLMAAGAFTTGILIKEAGAPAWIALPASAAVGGLLGLLFGLPSLRLKGLYLAISTLALHFIVVFLGGEYETVRGFSTGVLVPPPELAGVTLSGGRAWFLTFLAADAAAILFAVNLLRARTGRAWVAIRDREVAAAALGIHVPAFKLAAFVVSSMLTAGAGSLFAYYRGFVSSEAFSLFLSVEYVAMVIIGGLGSLLGAVLGAAFVVLFPYAIDGLVDTLPVPGRFATYIFAVKYASFGLIMIGFLVFEPLGLVGIWHRLRDYFLLWPFRHRPLTSRR